MRFQGGNNDPIGFRREWSVQVCGLYVYYCCHVKLLDDGELQKKCEDEWHNGWAVAGREWYVGFGHRPA